MASSSRSESDSLPVSSAVQSVKHKGATRANPDNLNIKVKIFFHALRRQIKHYMPLYIAFCSGCDTAKFLPTAPFNIPRSALCHMP